MLAESGLAGCEMVTLLARWQPFASVTVHVQSPATRSCTVDVFCTGVVFQEKLYGAVPPEAITCAAPSFPAKQRTLLVIDPTAFSSGACVSVVDEDALHPLSSVSVKV